MKNKKIKAWGVVDRCGLEAVGNGKQYQYPIFPTRKEAKEYMLECHGVTEIIQVNITYKI